jgi:hypothetical protein
MREFSDMRDILQSLKLNLIKSNFVTQKIPNVSYYTYWSHFVER